MFFGSHSPKGWVFLFEADLALKQKHQWEAQLEAQKTTSQFDPFLWSKALDAIYHAIGLVVSWGVSHEIYNGETHLAIGRSLAVAFSGVPEVRTCREMWCLLCVRFICGLFASYMSRFWQHDAKCCLVFYIFFDGLKVETISHQVETCVVHRQQASPQEVGSQASANSQGQGGRQVRQHRGAALNWFVSCGCFEVMIQSWSQSLSFKWQETNGSFMFYR